MKFAKMLFASLAVFALSLALSSSASAQTTKIFEYTGTGGFTIATGTHADLTNTSNWTQRTVAPSCPNGTAKICYISVTYTCNSNPPSPTCPTDQDLFNALDSKYTVNTPPTANAFTFDAPPAPANQITVAGVGPNGGVTVVFTLFYKA